MKKKTVALMLALNMLTNPAMSSAAGVTIPGFYGKVLAPAVNQLPTNGTVVYGGNNVTIANPTSDNVLNITQTTANAVIKWDTFDIGAKATVRFYQGTGTPGTANWTPNSSYAVLNRIMGDKSGQPNPSQIYGSLKADGKVYIINQNGILFSSTSQVNVHSFIASTLNMRDSDFLNGALKFTAENYQDPANSLPATYSTNAAVSNMGNITTDSTGSVYLLGPYVENGGTITAPQGSIKLISALPPVSPGTDSVAYDVQINSDNTVTYNRYASGGITYNLATGSLISDAGKIGMYGRTVNHDGLIRAVTSVKVNGSIELRASDSVTTGASSRIESPISDSADTVNPTYFRDALRYDSGTFGGQVTIGGLQTAVTGSGGESIAIPPANNITLNGTISAPAGNVTLSASGLTYLENGSLIDVSGVWQDKPASAATISAQLNGVELADDYGQKNGLPKGATVQTTIVNGSAVGNISGTLTGQDMTALDAATKGGMVIIGDSTANNLIVKEGATIAFAGGGVRYAAGTYNTTKLVSGNRVYDIASAPEWLTYDAILNSQTIKHSRFGVSETYSGVYLGGANALMSYSPGFVVGSNAGSAKLAARRVVLDGALKGAVTSGIYQTRTTSFTPDDHAAYDLSVAQGTEAPVAGTLIIGNNNADGFIPSNNDFIVNEIELKEDVAPLAKGFLPADVGTLTDTKTYLSATRLASYGLNNIQLATNNTFTSDSDSRLTLLPGATFQVFARRIVHQGEITVPGGTVDMSIYSNYASSPSPQNSYVPMDMRIVLAAGSVVNVAGERVDNSQANTANGAGVRTGRIMANGGTVNLNDLSEEGVGVFISQGSRVDVSGGYIINQKGTITGGDAGTVNITGPNILLQGDIKGLAIAGTNSSGALAQGGQIVLQTDEITVTTNPSMNFNADTDPGQLPYTLELAPDRFVSSGFSRIELRSKKGLTVTADSFITPSRIRLDTPIPGGGTVTNNISIIGSETPNGFEVLPEYLGASSVTLSAGVRYFDRDTSLKRDVNAEADSKLIIEAGGGVITAPGGTISLSGPEVKIAGTLQALGGNISATATKAHNLTIDDSGRIIATGYNKPNLTAIGNAIVGSSPQPGGKVTLAALEGDLVLAADSLVDVSGSKQTVINARGADGLPHPLTVAGDPGTLTLSYMGNLTLDGTLNGGPKAAGVRGGGLTINNLSSASDLAVTADAFQKYLNSGFDALTFQSQNYISLSGTGDITCNGQGLALRSLTLDAPHIKGSGSDDITVSAPWITVTNSTLDNPTPSLSGASAGGSLNLMAGWLDLKGSVTIEGFHDVGMTAQHDIRFTDLSFAGTVLSWNGVLAVSDNLTMKAARIYPNTLTTYTVNAGGKITILSGDNQDTSPIYSAGGNLTLMAAGGIEQRGTLAAPMGTITLDAETGRAYLADGSVTTTAGQTAVMYGSLDDSGVWTYQDRATGIDKKVTGLPGKGVSIKGNDVIVRQGAQIDLSGGGSISSYIYQPGIEGTISPFDPAKNRYVVLPGNPITATGAEVYLSGGGGLAAGYYALLPEQYAFLPGARVISDIGVTVAPGQTFKTAQGYNVVAGYATVAGTNIRPPQMEGYSVRLASDVLKEGNYTLATPLVAGDAGTLSLKAVTTTILDGNFKALALPGYLGGILDLSGSKVTVLAATTPLPGSFNFDSNLSDVSPSLVGTVQIAASTISGKGLQELDLGVIDTVTPANSTSTVTIAAGSKIDVPVIKLSAADSVTIGDGAQIGRATATDGAVTMTSQQTISIGNNALVQAAKTISLTGPGIDLKGNLAAGQALNLTAANVLIVGANDSTDPSVTGITGLYLTDSQLQGWASTPTVTLAASAALPASPAPTDGTIIFRGDHNLTFTGAIVLDAARISGQSNVQIAASRISLQNSGSESSAPLSTAAAGSLTLTAGQMQLGPGSVTLDGFGNISLTSTADLTLTGKGSLVAAWNGYSAGQQMNIHAARVTSALYRTSGGSFAATDYTIAGDYGGVSLLGAVGGIAGQTAGAGGSLQVRANQINVATLIDMPSGTVRMTTTDTGAGNGINLKDGADIRARGGKFTTSVPDQFSYSPGGVVELRSGAGSVSMSATASIDVSAYEDSSENYYGDAGAITVVAPAGASLAGNLYGHSQAGGKGGSFTLDTNNLDIVNGVNRLTTLNSLLTGGGFNETLDLRARTGNLTVDAGQNKNIAARKIVLTADDMASGNIDVLGAVTALADAKGNGGSVEMYAQTGLTLENGSSISAQAAGFGASGGNVVLSSMDGAFTDVANAKVFNGTYALQVKSGAQVNVSGMADASGVTKGGTVTFRAYQGKAQTGDTSLNDLNMAALPSGTITGASRVSVEAVRSYLVPQTSAVTATTPANANIGAATAYLTDAKDFMTAVSGVKTRLFGNSSTDSTYHLQAGIELRSADKVDLTLDTTWNLSPTTANARPGGEPGVITLRSSGNLTINGSIVDYPTPASSLTSTTAQDTWGINLIAGGDPKSANPFAVQVGKKDLSGNLTGNLTIADGAVVYSEKAPVRFAAGNDAILGVGSPVGYMIRYGMGFTLGSYAGNVTGYTGRDLIVRTNSIDSGAIQTATGNITLNVGRDLVLAGNDYVNFYPNHIGAIRTTGESSHGNIPDYWNYAGGGSIDILAGHAVMGGTDQDLSKTDWDSGGVSRGKPLPWSANYSGSVGRTTEGIATMGGGDITINSRADFTGQSGTFGKGDLRIFSGGDLRGRFLVKNGVGDLTTLGSFGDPSVTEQSKNVLETFSGQLTVTALGSIDLGTVVNPTLANPAFSGSFTNVTYSYYDPAKGTADSSVRLAAQSGDVSIYGTSYYYGNGVDQYVLPPVLEVYAGNNIHIRSNIFLTPSPTGNLRLWAFNDITGDYMNAIGQTKTAEILASDVDPSGFYGTHTGVAIDAGNTGHSSTTPLHSSDPDSAVIHAGRDISNFDLTMPKKADIYAGTDIQSLLYRGWNMKASDVTDIYAGGDIVQTPVINEDQPTAANKSYIMVGGPGLLMVQAGRNIDLSTSYGIQTDGNFGLSPNGSSSSSSYFALPSAGANLVVLAGLTEQVSVDRIDTFFAGIREAGTNYSTLLAEGKSDEAQAAIAQARKDLIAPLFGGTLNGDTGTISMTRSKISSVAPNPLANDDPDKVDGGSNVYILSRSREDIGQSTFVTDANRQNSGIYTASGGAINIFSGGDVNINESRVMTFFGGDIAIWSDQGSINAGRGSKTSVSSSPPAYNPNTGAYEYSPPAVGSGIRAVTRVDPNDPTGRVQPAGDIYLFAPQGAIDAGEAGIAGNKLVLGATVILHPDNIDSISGSVGLPSAGASVNLGALAGAGSVAETSKMAAQSSALGANKDNLAQQANLVNDFLSRFLDVKVINFDTDEGNADNDKQDEVKKKK